MSSPTQVTKAFSDALSSLVGDPDVADVLWHLVTDCAEALNADSVAILARDDHGDLALLTASTHRAVEMELLQIQSSSGPCVDVVRSNEALSAGGSDEIRRRWGPVGDAIVEAGYSHVEAFPMRWRGLPIGGLNVFRTTAPETPDLLVGQAFADVATLAVVFSTPVSAEEAALRLQKALDDRTVVEQAKGAIAYLEKVELSTAFELLVRRSEESGRSLMQTASEVLQEQRQRRPPQS